MTTIAERKALLGIAGPNCINIIEAAKIALTAKTKKANTLSNPQRIADRAANLGSKGACWFATYTDLFKKGSGKNEVSWREGREQIFSTPSLPLSGTVGTPTLKQSTDNSCCSGGRDIKLYMDSAGFGRELRGNAPKWAYERENYYRAIETAKPDGFAAFDFPKATVTDKVRSLEALYEMAEIFSNEVDQGKLWPVWSVRWSYEKSAFANFQKIGKWANRPLARLIPITKTQKRYREATLERVAREAVANALITAADSDFRAIINRFGQCMLGGMIHGPINRVARHLYFATLKELFPEAQFWGLGQASATVVNGLNMMGLIDSTWLDGTWYIKEGTSEKVAIVDSSNGLITMNALGRGRNKETGKLETQAILTTQEMISSCLKGLLCAYNGQISWPFPLTSLPIDVKDIELMMQIKNSCQAVQLELFPNN